MCTESKKGCYVSNVCLAMCCVVGPGCKVVIPSCTCMGMCVMQQEGCKRPCGASVDPAPKCLLYAYSLTWHDSKHPASNKTKNTKFDTYIMKEMISINESGPTSFSSLRTSFSGLKASNNQSEYRIQVVTMKMILELIV